MKAKIWKPEDQVYMDYQEIEAFVVELMKLYKVTEVAYDPAFFERSAQVLLDRGVPMVNFPQTHHA